MMVRPTTWSIVGEWDFKKWRLTYASYKKSLKNGKAPASIDLEDEDGDKGTLPRLPRGHKATTSDIKRDAAALALRRPLPRERRRGARRRRPHVINSLTSQKKSIKVEESMPKAKALEAEAKLMDEERKIMFIDTTNMMECKRVGWRNVVPSSNNETRDRA
jgi:hypothetical protein